MEFYKIVEDENEKTYKDIRQKELEEKCNNITEENMNIVEWGTDKDITYIINAINNSCYKSEIKFELIEAVIAVARKNKLE